MNSLQNIMGIMDEWAHSEGFETKHVTTRIVNAALVPAELLAIIENVANLALSPIGITAKYVLFWPTRKISGFFKKDEGEVVGCDPKEGKLDRAYQALPGFGDILHRIGTIFKLVIGTASTLTLGFLAPQWNVELHHKLGLVHIGSIDKRNTFAQKKEGRALVEETKTALTAAIEAYEKYFTAEDDVSLPILNEMKAHVTCAEKALNLFLEKFTANDDDDDLKVYKEKIPKLKNRIDEDIRKLNNETDPPAVPDDENNPTFNSLVEEFKELVTFTDRDGNDIIGGNSLIWDRMRDNLAIRTSSQGQE